MPSGAGSPRVEGFDPTATLLSQLGKLRARLSEMTHIVESLCALKTSGGDEALIEAAIIAQRHAEVLREASETVDACEQSAASFREQRRRVVQSSPPAIAPAPPSEVPALLEPHVLATPSPAVIESDGGLGLDDEVEDDGPVTQVDPRFRRVLVVDDEPAVLRAFRRVLQHDYEVVTARSGAEALRIVLSDSHLDGILCDLAMPELDGPAFFAELKELCPQLLPRVVFVTGGMASEKSQHFVEGLHTPVLHKPVTADALLNALEAVRG